MGMCAEYDLYSEHIPIESVKNPGRWLAQGFGDT